MAGERPQFLLVLMTGWASDQKNAYTLGRKCDDPWYSMWERCMYCAEA